MKSLYLILVVGLVLTACSTTKLTPQEKAQKRMEKSAMRAEVSAEVSKALADKHFMVNIDHMYPMRGPSRTLNGVYSLQVEGDTITSYLPYFGRAYSIPYNGGMGLNFNAKILSYDLNTDDKGIIHVKMQINNSEDTYKYALDVYDNGQTTLNVYSQMREPISFSGQMDMGK